MPCFWRWGGPKVTVFPLSLDRCGPLGGNLAQALLFSRTAYGCSPQCLLPASSLEVKVSEPSRERKLLASLAVDVIRNHPSLKKKKKETIHPDAGSHAGRVVRTPRGLTQSQTIGHRPRISDLAHLRWGLSICDSNKLPVLLPLLV